jgi:hypothetical protein
MTTLAGGDENRTGKTQSLWDWGKNNHGWHARQASQFS